jgi:hypothetical protein
MRPRKAITITNTPRAVAAPMTTQAHESIDATSRWQMDRVTMLLLRQGRSDQRRLRADGTALRQRAFVGMRRPSLGYVSDACVASTAELKTASSSCRSSGLVR